MVPYVDAVVVVIVMRVLLFVLHVGMLRECDGDGNAGVVAVRGLGLGFTNPVGTGGLW